MAVLAAWQISEVSKCVEHDGDSNRDSPPSPQSAYLGVAFCIFTSRLHCSVLPGFIRVVCHHGFWFHRTVGRCNAAEPTKHSRVWCGRRCQPVDCHSDAAEWYVLSQSSVQEWYTNLTQFSSLRPATASARTMSKDTQSLTSTSTHLRPLPPTHCRRALNLLRTRSMPLRMDIERQHTSVRRRPIWSANRLRCTRASPSASLFLSLPKLRSL